MSLETWGESVQEEMYDIWKADFGSHELGIEPFTSPFPEDPSVIIVGYNPGVGQEYQTGKKESFSIMERFDAGDFTLPESHHYAVGGEDYPIARMLRMHVFNDHEEILTDSIETNRYWLRTGKSHDHRSALADTESTWSEYKEFCKDTLAELLSKADPDVIVPFGMQTLDSLKNDSRYDYEQHDVQYRSTDSDRNIRLLAEGQLDAVPVLGLHHLSYLEGNEEDLERIETVSTEFFNKHC